jgi:hypothetical protein
MSKGVAMTPRLGSRLSSLAALGCLLAAPLAQAETPLGVHSVSEAKAMYRNDMQACRSGATSEDKRTCMLEAKRAYEQGLREAGGSRHAMKARHSRKSDKTAAAQ